MSESTPTIELVYDPECPNVEAARKQLRLALNTSGLPDEWREWDRDHADSPSRVGGFGSPTILVNGRDIAGASAPGANNCRVYWGDNGELAGFPSQTMIVTALGGASGDVVGGPPTCRKS